MRYREEKGGVTVEACIILPVFLITAIVLWDASSALYLHSLVVRSARELVRSASGAESLEIGETQLVHFDAPRNGGTCLPDVAELCNPVCLEGFNLNVYRGPRQTQLLCQGFSNFRNSQLPPVDLDQTLISLRRDVATDTVSVLIRTRYSGFLPPFANMTITVEQTGPYL